MKSFLRLLVIFIIIVLSIQISPSYAEKKELRILYINDFHGFAEPYTPIGSNDLLGGISYLASRLNILRKEKPSIFLAAGDMIQGSNWANYFQGESVIQVLNTMGLDAMVVGNHEFDFGKDTLKKRIAEAVFPILGANVEGLESLKAYTIKEINGLKIAIIGVVTDDTPITTHPKNVIGIKFNPPKETIEKYVNKLKNSVDLIILLSHIGYNLDRRIAEEVKGIDIIIGGHSHTKVVFPTLVNNTIVLQAWEHAKSLGVLDIEVENKKISNYRGYLEDIRPIIQESDRAVQLIVESYNQRLLHKLEEVIGETLVDLDGENVRVRETNLGNLIADVIKDVSGADVAIINGGSIRSSIKKGVIKIKDIYSALPFDNYILSLRVYGHQLKQLLEDSLSTIHNKEGRFPQISGISIIYNPSNPPNSRITKIMVGQSLLDDNKEYIVATNDFLAVGGDGYTIFRDILKSSNNFDISGGVLKSEKIVYADPGRWIRDVIIEYIKKEKKINPSVEGRIREVNISKKAPLFVD
jgi:2',3'-cyclic-nucleotide 2'-phosphodiesterase (5'-nucleotidase family)